MDNQKKRPWQGSTTTIDDDNNQMNRLCPISIDKLSAVSPHCVFRSLREHPPAHYTMKIQSFKTLQASLVDAPGENNYIESTTFNIAGYNWVLCVYPSGNKEDDGNGHVSLYLKLIDKLKDEDVVTVVFRFFIHDQKRDNYLIIQDMKNKRFHVVNIEWRISRALALSIFEDASNGYLVNDSCLFGVEVLVIDKGTSTTRGCVSSVQQLSTRTYAWKIMSYSHKKADKTSPIFTVEGRSWNLLLHPQGNGIGAGQYVSLFLILKDLWDLTNGKKLYVEYELCIKNQAGYSDFKSKCRAWFHSSVPSWGFSTFLALDVLRNPTFGYLKDD
ncbi:hypothetical protein Droror1_Dr00026145 [Drosera rotundifolia]